MANKVAKMEWKVTEEVKLAPELEKTTTDLSEAEKAEIKEQALKRMDEIDPMLRHTMDVKVVRNQRRNFINIRVRPDYATLLFQHKGGYGVRYCFFISDKLEPYIIITAVSPVEGKLQRLAKSQVEELEEGVKRFKEQYGISGESYHYTKVFLCARVSVEAGLGLSLLLFGRVKGGGEDGNGAVLRYWGSVGE